MTRPRTIFPSDQPSILHWISILAPVALALAAASTAWTVSMSRDLAVLEEKVEAATRDVRELRGELGECCPRGR